MPEAAEATRERPKSELGVCEDCGYELTFVNGAACPECGAPATVMIRALSRRYLPARRVMLGATLILWGIPAAAIVFLVLVTISTWLMQGDLDLVKAAMSVAFVPLCIVVLGAWFLAWPLGDAGSRARWGLRAVCAGVLLVACMLMAQRVVARMPGAGPGSTLPISSVDVRDKLRWALLALAPP